MLRLILTLRYVEPERIRDWLPLLNIVTERLRDIVCDSERLRLSDKEAECDMLSDKLWLRDLDGLS